MTMKYVHSIWRSICQCIVATQNCEEEGRPFCSWSLSVKVPKCWPGHTTG